jgi:Dolichyl-phosphate-mannose-protein mannosyltransferase
VSTQSSTRYSPQADVNNALSLVRQVDALDALVDIAQATARTVTIPAVEQADQSAAVSLPETVATPGATSPWARQIGGPVPLACVLAVQAVLSFRLLRSNTAFADEALYLWAGHLEWAHLLHGVPLPPFATYFSGSPVIYPAIGALADSIGGLAAARALSGCFMLIATALLWSTTARLYGKRAALPAAGLWAVLGPTLHMGAFATYDAMALMLLALATWCAVRAAASDASAYWVVAAAGAAALANATKYASALWDPVVVAAAVFSVWPVHGRKVAIRHGAVIASYLVIFLVLLLALATIANRNYVTGIDATTFARQHGTKSAAQILYDSWSWTQVLAIAAVAGLAAIWRSQRAASGRALGLTLAVGGLLAPLNQARLHTDVSLIKHTDYGAWFTAVVAGYLMSQLMNGGWTRRALCAAVAAAAIVCTAVIGFPQARGVYHGWPNTTRVLAMIRPLVGHTSGPILFQNPSILEYYFQIGAGWKQINGQHSLRLSSGRTIDIAPVGSEGIARPYLSFVRTGYFKVIVLNDYGNNPYDRPMVKAISANPDYVEIGRTSWQDGNFIVWQYQPRRP